ncbi:MAG: OmpA family protein [Termitinemataceae bacterium]|nr:MAG: OmpA family protein [Termitinemataceae bacterium]
MKARAFHAVANLLFLCAGLFADDWTLTERSNFSRYDNGKYIGHVYREVRTNIKQDGEAVNGFIPYRSSFVVIEETLRDMREAAKPFDAVITSKIKIAADGNMQVENDKGYPALRNFPVYPLASIQSGETKEGFSWTAEAKRAIYLDGSQGNQGKPIVFPFLAEYVYQGTSDYNGVPAHHITARYASRYASNESDNSTLKSISGSHDVDIWLSVKNGMLLMQRDKLDETFSWTNGSSTRYNGFTLIFGQGIPGVDKRSVITDIKSTENIDVEQVDNGLRLRIKDLRFKSDSDELLDGDDQRLDEIAKALLTIKKRLFLVEGHTAKITGGEDELILSKNRASRIVSELVKRGLSAASFVYKGYGGTRPVGDNSSEDGRRLNRRVEITILE